MVVCHSLEIIAFKTIPRLMTGFREDVKDAHSDCPRMCKTKFKPCNMRGFNIKDINKKLSKTKRIASILKPTWAEENLLAGIGEEEDLMDDIVDGWTRRIVDEQKAAFFPQYREENIKTQKKKATKRLVNPLRVVKGQRNRWCLGLMKCILGWIQ